MPFQSPPIVLEQSELEAHCRRWRSAGRFAFDTEFIRDETYDAELCLVQVSDGREVVLIDPLADLDVAPFWELVCDPDVLTIVHAGKEDFEVCLRHTGRAPRRVFDVQIAAGFVGLGYPISLTRLVQQVLHRRLVKGQTLTDWQRRPLTEQQLRYAVEDVAHLPPICDRLSAEIERRGRSAWAREEFERFESADFYQRAVSERIDRFKGASRLDRLGLAVLERLVAWRDAWAQERNRPPRAMMRDDVVLEIARRRPSNGSDLEVMRGFPQSRNPKIIRQILDIIAEARRIPPGDLPEAPAASIEAPMTRVALDLLSAVARAICHEESLSVELVGSSQRLRELLDHTSGQAGETPALLQGWRAEFIGRRLCDLLEGRCELHFSGWPDNPRLRTVSHGGGNADASADR
jgi:ribonuclease D